MYLVPSSFLLLIAIVFGFLESQYVSSFWIPLQPRVCQRQFSGSFQQVRKEDEDEWQKRRTESEEKQREWEEKIRAKNERKNSSEKLTPKAKTTSASKTTDSIDTSESRNETETESCTHYVSKDAVTFAQAHSAELIALAGPKFDGDLLGVGGLDDVIAEIKRRVWTPLAAPPAVLNELGITPVRGLMLYGQSGCGKTLLARTIGKLLSPARPLTVVSGPQLMDKFVGSSEKNLRELFDNPSPVYDPYRISGGKGMDKAALHVIVLDEFDAMARTRGGPDSANTAAGVARDSVVNQILSKMDGVDPLSVPTLVIAMTNRPNLIDPALLRPGRFEVQIEVPPPKTKLQRKSILNVHMNRMHEAGRLEVRDAPKDGCVSPQRAQQASMSYDDLLDYLAQACEGFSGASLAAIPRAAASRALERAVTQYSVDLNENRGKQDAIAMLDCVVQVEDLESAVQDVRRSASTTKRFGQEPATSSSSAATSQQCVNGNVEIEDFVNSDARI